MRQDQSPTLLYLIISQEMLSLYFLKQQSSWFSRAPKKYMLIGHATIAIPDATIYEGTLYNPSRIETLVRNTLATHRIKEIKTILILPYLSKIQPSHQEYVQIFSYLVCLSNAGCIIESCYAKLLGNFPINNNQAGELKATSPDLLLTYRQPSLKKLIPWLSSTLGAGVVLSLIIGMQVKNIHTHTQSLITQKTALDHSNQTLHTSCGAQTKLSNTWEKISSSKPYKDILIQLGDLLPDQTWIEHLELVSTATIDRKPASQAHLQLEGVSRSISELSGFIAKMKKTEVFNKLQLLHMQKESSQTASQRARFKLAGVIPWHT